MRKAQKLQAEELVRQMEEAHDQIKKYIEQDKIPLAMELLEECQNGGITLGTLIENTEGEGHPTVLLLEEYCELAYQLHENLASSMGPNKNKIYKLLRQKLIRISNSLKNDIQLRLEVAFFPYKASMWDSLESIYLAARIDPACDVYCVPIPYYDMNPDHSFGKMHYEGRDYPKGIEVFNWETYDFEERKPDVIYIHNPYDDCNLVTSVHPRFYSSNLRKYTSCLVYVPYYSTLGGMSSAQSLCPVYIYADYIVIQSSEFRKYFDASIPDQKFLAFGSPKFDRIIRKCQNPPEPSTHWIEKMSGRRVYFYNTSIAGMLADTENFLQKMNYVFRCFEGRKDVCLLWRPHPLMEATFDSMRPQYRHVYDALKYMFLKKNLGILDTTPDIADAIALSDAYIGDAGTSVTSLFGIAGKPIFILDNRIHNEPREDSWRDEIEISHSIYSNGRFAITQGNKLYVSEPDEYRYKYYCDLAEYSQNTQYSIVYEINEKLYACPDNAQDILVIGKDGVEKVIKLDEKTKNKRAFCLALKSGKYLLLIPLNYPAVVRFDTQTEQICYFKDYVDVFVRNINGRNVTGHAMVHQGKLYIASPVDNQIYKMDVESGEIQIVELPIKSRCGGFALSEYRNEIWIMPYEGKEIVRWNLLTDRVREYSDYPKEFSCLNSIDGCEGPAFNIPAFYGEYVYLAPGWANMYLKLNIHTGEFSRWQPSFDKNEIISEKETFLPRQTDEEADGFRLYSFTRRKMYAIDNMETLVCKEKVIQFDKEELMRHESGFGKCSAALQYACVENCFNSLGRFLDGEIVGGQFNREEQLSVYSGIAVNHDGSCGQKVHEYIMRKQYG